MKTYELEPGDGPVWITGGSSGIGKELAIRLAASGWTVAVTARSEDSLRELETQAQELRGEIRAFPGDVTHTDEMQQVCKSIGATLGTPALLIANAGVYLPQDGLNAEADAFRKSFDVNLMGVVNVLLPVIEQMKGKGSGHIAIVSSVAGYSGLPTSAAYGATKAGLINLAESLKFDLDLAGIHIQIICPGFVDTPATKDNPFPMPHLVSVETAANEIVKGLRHPEKFEITFPKGFVRQLKVLRMLPYGLYFRIVAKATGWTSRKAG